MSGRIRKYECERSVEAEDAHQLKFCPFRIDVFKSLYAVEPMLLIPLSIHH